MAIDILLGFFIFLLGLCIGSFLNVVVYRLEKGEGFVKGRSYCPHCKHSLSWLDLVPVFSFVCLGEKCRYCKKKISRQYPLVELATGLLFLSIFNFQLSSINQFGIFNIIHLVFLFYIVSVFIIIFIYDLKHYLILDKVLFPAIIITFMYRLFENLTHWNLIGNWAQGIGNSIAAAIVASGFFLAIFLISKGEWMGFGDVKLAMLLGLLLGWPNILVGLFLSFLLGAIIGVILLFFKKKGLKSEIPFAPFLIMGTFIALFFGLQLMHWYTHFLLV